MTKSSDSDGNGRDNDYEVGYRRPPQKTQFKPGQSGNPNGRKRKPKSVRAQMQNVILKKVSINEGGTKRSLPVLGVILRVIANKAAKGDLKAAEFVFKLLNSSEYADTDAIDQTGLSADDQAMLDEVMKQLTKSDGTGPPARSRSIDEENAVTEPSAERKESHLRCGGAICATLAKALGTKGVFR